MITPSESDALERLKRIYGKPPQTVNPPSSSLTVENLNQAISTLRNQKVDTTKAAFYGSSLQWWALTYGRKFSIVQLVLGIK